MYQSYFTTILASLLQNLCINWKFYLYSLQRIIIPEPREVKDAPTLVRVLLRVGCPLITLQYGFLGEMQIGYGHPLLPRELAHRQGSAVGSKGETTAGSMK
ncbi:hypothetical protein AVEN_81088-1 [Araneus ventricosus]|uniref:Uncharacterized protein n=1 Tax=Araneus ventricosus TaxID=182803 RepID=A0A4Y2JUK3_ARAVE|nr:hypothetical protein AVEN_81088-1 [Araneus ventricosus]